MGWCLHSQCIYVKLPKYKKTVSWVFSQHNNNPWYVSLLYFVVGHRTNKLIHTCPKKTTREWPLTSDWTSSPQMKWNTLKSTYCIACLVYDYQVTLKRQLAIGYQVNNTKERSTFKQQVGNSTSVTIPKHWSDRSLVRSERGNVKERLAGSVCKRDIKVWSMFQRH